MRRVLAAWFNERGSKSIDSDKASRGEMLYKLALAVDPRWSVPWYNLGLQTKNSGRRKESLRFNQRALELDPTDEAAWWNLGIAATALHEWTEARRAWRGCGIEMPDESGEVLWAPGSACVRLDPNNSGEVVWGQRLDPARFEVLNVPLPESNHRYRDVVLNDGASKGTRTDEDGYEVPVFDELSIWKVSEYSTFRVIVHISKDSAEKHLVDLCLAHQLGVEDWTTIRIICAKCSRGNPGAHECEAKPLEDGSRRFGFGAKNEEDLLNVLREWTTANVGADFGEVELVLRAKPN